jgi:hypothetical protein
VSIRLRPQWAHRRFRDRGIKDVTAAGSLTRPRKNINSVVPMYLIILIYLDYRGKDGSHHPHGDGTSQSAIEGGGTLVHEAR